MNFPPIIFHDPKFGNIFTNNYNNQNLSTIMSYQILYKKILKFENKDKNFQSSVISWIKSLAPNQLIKYFSLGNQWLIDVLQEMILINKMKSNIKFIFIPPPKTNTESDLPFFNLLDPQNFENYSPCYHNYFSPCYDGIVNLSKPNEKERIKISFIDNIRYLTIPINKPNYINNSHNPNCNSNDKFFFEYNNVITLSYECLSNIDLLIENMKKISKEKVFENPIKIETIDYEGRKSYYNACLPEWLETNFSLAELLCCYFEQSI